LFRARRPAVVRFGEAEASLALAAETALIARVRRRNGGMVASPRPARRAAASSSQDCKSPKFAPVANPAVDHDGNIYVTFPAAGPAAFRFRYTKSRRTTA